MISTISILIPELCRTSCPVKAAIFDFDGTISTLRCGWEGVMEKIMLEQLAGCSLSNEELTTHVRRYIDESTGIQTIYQMEWLAEQVCTLCSRTPLDPWEYKDLYNDALMKMVQERVNGLSAGTVNPEAFLVPGSREYLEQLSKAGIAIYIASGTDEEDVRREADLLEISPLVREVRGAPHRRKDCSKEAVIREILETGALAGNELMVVGDGKVEIQLGCDAGALTLGIASQELRKAAGMNLHKLKKLQKAGARYIAADFIPFLQNWKMETEESK